MGLGMEGDDFYYWTLKRVCMDAGGGGREGSYFFLIRAVIVSSKRRNADFRTH
jgi:hypothetical protein